MDDVNDFFDFSKPFKRVAISGGYVNGRVLPANDAKSPVKREKLGTEYAKEYQDAEAEQLEKTFKNYDAGSNVKIEAASQSSLNELEDDFDDDDAVAGPSSSMGCLKSEVDVDPVFEKYAFNHIAPDLPIINFRSEILDAVHNHPVVVLQGATGCGKSTQVPQFLLDDAYKRKKHCNIIVTQPRKIAARSIASRVCNERKWEIGSLVGYQVSLNTVSSDDTRILFCTTGILLEKLIRTKSMAKFTHIILDEVHEREQDMDFLFIVVRRLLATNSPNCKVILMSATIDAPLFADYFRIPKLMGGGKSGPAPIINVQAKRPFTVNEFYLCQLSKLRIDDAEVRLEEPGISDAMYSVARKLVIVAERIDNQDQVSLPADERARPTILIFLPGILEIQRMYKLLDAHVVTGRYQLFPLHSTITFEEQQNVFRPVQRGVRKIVLSTNIAESSITIPDVKYVIDFCLTRMIVTDTATNISSLQLAWASRNNCIQRSGRAGRVMNGRVYRLVPRIFFDELMEQSAKPEMLSCPLDRVVLKSKMLDMGPPRSILALAMDQPNLSDINNTILMLKELGGLLKTTAGVFSEHDGDMSFIGRVMCALPIDMHLSRLIVFGHCFSVLEECIIIAAGAGLSGKGIFNNPFGQELQAYSKKLRWSDGSGSDLFAILKAYRCWQAQHHQNNFKDEITERHWASRYYLQVRSLKEMALLVAEITTRLDKLGIRERTGVHRVQWTPAEKSIILKCVISGAFYPNYFSRVGHDESFDRESFKTLCGRDPNTTVFFTNFHHKYVGQLYVQAIKDMFQDIVCSKKNVHVSFDNNTEKIFVSFRSHNERETDEYLEAVPGSVATEVYKAVKMRRTNSKRIMLDVMNPKAALEMAEHCGLGFVDCGVLVPKEKQMKNIEMIALPRTSTKEVYGRVTHVESPGRFFVRACEENTLMRTIFDDLNHMDFELEPFDSVKMVTVGMVVATRYNGEFHRAKVIVITRTENSAFYRVRIIDFGMTVEVKFSDLRQLTGNVSQYVDLPPRVFECRLAELQPSSMTSEKCVWTTDSIITFGQLVDGLTEDVCVQIYSVVKRVARVVLLAAGVNVNEFLVSEGHAQVCDEHYMSKQDHVRRLKRQTMAYDEHTNQLDEAYLQELGDIGSEDEDDDTAMVQPTKTQCYTAINLSGPFSPLESNVYSVCGSSMHQNVNIDPLSVNSVLLEDRSQDLKNTFVVAASVSRSSLSNKLTARGTTLMPNIPGFGALMAIIFCPYMEFQQDRTRSRYTSVLCGLGQHPTENRPVFEEHDVRFDLDVEISTDDLQWINQIRFSMDAMLYTKAGEECPNLLESKMYDYAQKIKTRIIQLLERDRHRVAAHPYRPHKWGYANSDDVVTIKNLYGDRAIFPFHSALRMSSDASPERIQQLDMWFANCKQLRLMAQIDASLPREIQCTLCQVTLASSPEIKMHLFSRLHIDREKNIGYVSCK